MSSEHRPAPVKPELEAILLVAEEPLDSRTLAAALQRTEAEVERALVELSAEYTDSGRGFDLRFVGSGWSYYTRPEHFDVVARFAVDGQQVRLTQAALETLAVVAYRQPISRARVAAIRGVSVDGVIRTLVSRGLVEERGSDPSSGAHLYGTTPYFLERMGLSSLDALPEIAPFLPEMAEIEDELGPSEGATDVDGDTALDRGSAASHAD
jgi:segregation and condensation protein B